MYIRLSGLARLQTSVEINKIKSCRKSSIRATNDENLDFGRIVPVTIHDKGVI